MEKNIGKFTVKTLVDNYPFNPRNECDNLGTMLCFHKRYDLGDKHEYNPSSYFSQQDLKKAISKKENVGVMLPIYMYDHSGITIKTTPFGCPWDSFLVGYICISKEKIREEFSCKLITKKVLEKVTECLISEVATYNAYLTGEMYRWVVLDGENEVECGDGYTDENLCLEDGVSTAKYLS